MSSRGRGPANPYAAPEAPLAFAADAVPSGGTLEQTLAGGTRLTTEGIISDAWKLIPGFKGTFWLAALGIFGASFVLGIVTAVMAQTTTSPLAASLICLLRMLMLGIGLIWMMPLGLVSLGMLSHRLAGYAGGETN